MHGFQFCRILHLQPADLRSPAEYCARDCGIVIWSAADNSNSLSVCVGRLAIAETARCLSIPEKDVYSLNDKHRSNCSSSGGGNNNNDNNNNNNQFTLQFYSFTDLQFLPNWTSATPANLVFTFVFTPGIFTTGGTKKNQNNNNNTSIVVVESELRRHRGVR